MKQELDYYRIGNAYGGSQAWFTDFMMRKGGCGAIAACDCCIYLAQFRGKKGVYPYDASNITKEDYLRFGSIMKPYLHPRITGIDTLEIYIKGFSKYLKNIGNWDIVMEPVHGAEPVNRAREVIKQQIDKGFVVPFLLLRHHNETFKNYEWHWFMITGYESFEDNCMVKAVTYGGFRWLDFNELWNTGYRKKGGFIVYREEEKEGC